MSYARVILWTIFSMTVVSFQAALTDYENYAEAVEYKDRPEYDYQDAMNAFYDYNLNSDNDCIRQNEACRREHMSFILFDQDGNYLTNREKLRVLQRTSLLEYCRHRAGYISCIFNLTTYELCPELTRSEMEMSKFYYDYQCVNNYEDAVKYRNCLLEIQYSQHAYGCYSYTFHSGTRSPEQYIQCLIDGADQNTGPECRAPEMLAGAKNYLSKSIQSLHEKNLLDYRTNYGDNDDDTYYDDV